MEYTIHRVGPGDEGALAHIQTESWRAAFCDIVSAEVLKPRTDRARVQALYRELLERGVGSGYLLRAGGEPRCIAWWNATRERDMPGYAELICIHSLPEHWRTGCGSRVLNVVLRDMAAAGYEWVMLWVFEKNTRARVFYERHGFAPTQRRKEDLGAVELCYEKRLSWPGGAGREA